MPKCEPVGLSPRVSFDALVGCSYSKSSHSSSGCGFTDSPGFAPRVIIGRRSPLRRLVVSDRWFFITCRLLPRRRILSPSEFAVLVQVIHERRAEHRFLLPAWVFLPDHWHVIFYPPHPLRISTVMEAIKDGTTERIKRGRRGGGTL